MRLPVLNTSFRRPILFLHMLKAVFASSLVRIQSLTNSPVFILQLV
jgi:hypothetical protein